ncbi:FAD-dependent oxidoreductase, partial [bacterium]|nr:FAD-dependent oxidoreductase [bacterium]
MAASTRVVVVGAGIFGVTAALELRVRGHAVSLLDPGPLPHALAASTDVSKVVRLEYGAGNEYMELAERALAGWHRWNRDLGEELYHETGILHLSRSPMKPGGFEHESFRLLEKRGHSPERLDARALGERFPAWRGGPFVDGFFHAKGGWVESGKVVSRLVRLAKERGVSLHEGVAFDRLLEKGSRVTGAIAKDGSRIEGDGVVVAAGAWTPHLLPFLSPYLRTRGMPVFHLRPRASEVFSPARFPVFTADIARTGYYGFPLHPELSIVKVA